jgi:cell division protein FtsZ
VPPPAYRPAAAPSQPTPAATVAMNHAPQERASSRPRHRPPGHPTPEALARLRDPARGAASGRRPGARRRRRRPSPAKTRFGINNLINRMTGHGDEGASPGRAPHAELLRPPAAEPYSGPRRGHDAVDPDQERIEIPAFLRRQAN